ncbi:unnamed protein product [Linum tenue]|uniref:UBA domain-containing protein n=1 Tax=Linum tenue TaxID=586396 RepID=A0AAV0KJP5_9ROSI|nr:unnamed protein product [Linum tenue]
MSPTKSRNKSKKLAGNSARPPQNNVATNPKKSGCSDPTPGLEILSSSPDSSSSPDHENSGSPIGALLLGSEPDSVSNNGSCYSGEEDPKEVTKTTATRLPDNLHVTVSGLDSDRREKIRLKNEKKHARQRERRAQELHERCCGFLMSRKLESLSQQIVAMGFSKDRATMALMMNDGKVEESVNWLFEGNGDDNGDQGDKDDGESSIPEKRNLGLKIEISDELAEIAALEVRFKCSKQEIERAVVNCEGDLAKATEVLASQKPEQPTPPPPPPLPPQANFELGVDVAAVPRQRMIHYSDPVNRNFQNQRWGNHGYGYNNPSLFQSPKFQQQHSQFMNSNQYPVQNSNTYSSTARWYSSNVPFQNHNHHHLHHRPSSYKETPFLFSGPNPMEASAGTRMGGGSSRSSEYQSFPSSSNLPSLAAPSSLGLFDSWGSPTSQVDWNSGGLMPNFDYTSIDWSLDSRLLPSKSRRMWLGLSSLLISNGSSASGNGGMEAPSSAPGLRDWTSPFAQKDMFSLSRQFVTSPSL